MITIKVKITPGAKFNKILNFVDDILKIKIHSIAEKGKANKELIYFLAKSLKISQSSIKIISGETSRLKIIKINISKEDFDACISSLTAKEQ